MVAKLKITLIKSPIGYPEDQKRTVQALGLKRLHQSVELEDSGSARGMVTKVRHLVQVGAAGHNQGTKTHRKTKVDAMKENAA